MSNIKIKQIGLQEFWVKKTRIVLSDKNIIHVTAVGEQTDEMADLLKEVNYKIFDMVDGKLNFLIDLNQSGKNSPKARSIWNELSAHDKLNRAAVFGLHPVARVIAGFVMRFSIKKNQRFFKTEEEARAWLAE